jgi:phage gp36-like protein
LDQAVAAIQMNDVVASNAAGKLKLSTIKRGYSQGLRLMKTGTANPLLNFDDLLDTDRRGTGSITGEFSDDEKSYALVSATSVAYSYLQRRYNFPLKNWGMDVIDNVCAIAAYKLVFREGYSPEPGSYDANWRKRYEDAIQWFSEVGNRKIHPVIEGASKPVPKANDGSISTDPRGWRIAMGLCDSEAR